MNASERKSCPRWLSLGMAAMALATSSCMNIGRPTTEEIFPKDGYRKTVVLIRVVTEVDGQVSPAFRATYSADSIWLGLGGFSSGGRLEIAKLHFLSKETRLDGWTYLLLEPGIYYLAPHPPQNENSFAYDRSWKETVACWRLEVPRDARVVYGGTLFVPGKGRWMIFGPRSLVKFEPSRFEVRDESTLAKSIQDTWLRELGTLTVKLVENFSTSEPIILETPPGR